jgi:hypothetical protein
MNVARVGLAHLMRPENKKATEPQSRTQRNTGAGFACKIQVVLGMAWLVPLSLLFPCTQITIGQSNESMHETNKIMSSTIISDCALWSLPVCCGI